MSRPSLILALILLTSACAHRDPLPVCDGAARRPANPHGSILTPAPAPVAPTPTAHALPEDASPEGGCA